MKVLLIGNGGREHAIGKKIKTQNPETQLFFASGNGGTQILGSNIPNGSPEELLEFAKKESIDLTIVGPEQPLVEGIVDLFQSHKIAIFGPHQEAAQLEGSKIFAKEFMKKYGVKTAEYHSFEHFVDAQEYIKKAPYPIVIKADGLAAGKGVVICQDPIEADSCIRAFMLDNQFGRAGNHIVIEEYLEGFEASILSIYNGKDISCMLTAKDHKKVGENETGLNTGGMGVVVPNPQFTSEHFDIFRKEILEPTVKGLEKEKLNFSGVIFFGLMITDKGIYLLEYNVRFGDPETQTVLPLLQSNLLDIFQKSIKGEPIIMKWKEEHCVCVVMCSGGYPLEYEKGFEIHGIENLKADEYDIAGAALNQEIYTTTGGRVLNILATGNTLENTRNKVYENVAKVRFDYNYYRKDIGTNPI